MSFALHQIPGYQEALLFAQLETVRTQEDDWLEVTQVIAGVTIRRATLRDYILMMRFTPSILSREMPPTEELLLLLWILSPERERWDYEPTGWRKWFPRLRQRERVKHGDNIKSALKIEELELAAAVYVLESDKPFEIPEGHPLAVAVDQLFKYIDNLFQMRPASMKGGAASGMHFLVQWFNVLQKHLHLPTAEIWVMPLPILFARLRDLQQIEMRGRVPDFNAKADALNRRIMDALRNGEFTEQELLAGKLKLN